MDTQPRMLLPNIGAEESHRDHQKLSKHPAVVHLGELWILSLGASGTLDQPGPITHHGPLLDWAHKGAGGLPWFASVGSEKDAKTTNQNLLGPNPKYVQKVHNKGFAAQLANQIGHTNGWEYSHIISQLNDTDEAQEKLKAILQAWPDWAKNNFTIKPCMGSAGRGRIAGKNSKLTTQHIQGLYKMTLRGGAIIEPWYATLDNLSTQLLIQNDGTYELLGHTSQILTTSGTYIGNHGILKSGHIASGKVQDETLSSIAAKIVPIIHKQGFYGVCGFDSFTFDCTTSDEVRLRAPLEINARFTSATIGISHVKEMTQSNQPQNGSWVFILDAKESWCDDAKNQKDWSIKRIKTLTTQKQALIAFSPETGAIEKWLMSIGLKN